MRALYSDIFIIKSTPEGFICIYNDVYSVLVFIRIFIWTYQLRMNRNYKGTG